VNNIKLSIMMFLQYFIWGAWYVTAATYMSKILNSSGAEIGNTYSAFAFAAIISPFFVGAIADRYFSAQKAMGALHLIGGLLLLYLTQVSSSFLFLLIVLFYSLMYMPTVAISNNIVFANVSDTGKVFPIIRFFGTFGWIIAGLVIGSNIIFGQKFGLGLEANNTTLPYTFYIASGASILLGVFSFTLPDVPPKGKTDSSSFGLEALVLLKDKSYLIFFISAVLICIPLSFYYSFANVFLNDIGMEGAAGKMILGQVSEAIFILSIPLLYYRLGVKNILIIGIAAWALRFFFFSNGDMSDDYYWMLMAGIVLHGICYDFFFVTGYMYTENKAGEKIKNAAQGLFTVATYGIGMTIGSWFSGIITDSYTVDGIKNWAEIWMIPAYISGAVLLFLMIFFKEKK
jgi:nucleoside transporter